MHTSNNSYVSTLSEDGKIAGGYINNKFGYSKAAIWTTNESEAYDVNAKFLGVLNTNTNDLTFSQVRVLSANGKITGGCAQNESMSSSDVIWITNDNWKTPTIPMDLGTLRTDRYGQVNVLSANGQIASGWASPNIGDKKAAIWFTNDSWKHVGLIDLGTLRKDNSGSSEVSNLSSDGTIIIGTADADDKVQHTFIKKVSRAVYANPDYLLTPKN